MSSLNSAYTYFYILAYLPIFPDYYFLLQDSSLMLSPRLYLRSPNELCVVTVLNLNRLFENTYICGLSRRLLLCANYLLFADHFQLFTLPATALFTLL